MRYTHTIELDLKSLGLIIDKILYTQMEVFTLNLDIKSSFIAIV